MPSSYWLRMQSLFCLTSLIPGGCVKTCKICGAHKSTLAGFLQMFSLEGKSDSTTSPRASLLPGPQPARAGPWSLWMPAAGAGPGLGVPISPLAWLRQLEGNGRSVLDIQSLSGALWREGIL